MRRVLFLWVRLVFFLYVVDAFWLPCCVFVDVLLWYSNTKLRIILMKFLVICVFSWVFLAALIMY
jgi:hypothetical protein